MDTERIEHLIGKRRQLLEAGDEQGADYSEDYLYQGPA